MPTRSLSIAYQRARLWRAVPGRIELVRKGKVDFCVVLEYCIPSESARRVDETHLLSAREVEEQIRLDQSFGRDMEEAVRMSAQIASVSDLRNVLVNKRLAKVDALNLPSGAVAKGALSSTTVDKVRLALHRTVALVPLAHERVGRVHVRLREGRRELGDVHVMLEVRRDQVLHRPKLAERGEGLGAERVGREEEHRPVGELDRGLRGEASAADQQHNTARAWGVLTERPPMGTRFPRLKGTEKMVIARACSSSRITSEGFGGAGADFTGSDIVGAERQRGSISNKITNGAMPALSLPCVGTCSAGASSSCRA